MLYITNMTEQFSFKCGHIVEVAKHLKEAWLMIAL